MDAETLLAQLPHELACVRTWSSDARAKYLDKLWEAQGVPRATRRAILRDLDGLTYEQIVEKFRPELVAEDTAAPATRGAPDQDADYWQALSDLAQMMKGMIR